MPNIIALLLLLLALPAAAADVALIGVIGDKAAVIAIDGGGPKTIKVGQTWSGVRIVAVEKTSATIEFEGRQRVLQLGQHHRGAPPSDARQSVTLSADPRGHFFADATVNDQPVRFVVDTGASVVVLSGADAARLGIDWRKGPSASMQTANGATTGYFVKLDRVRVGGIELRNIDGVVVEQGLGSFGLLGMSFLNRLEMRRDGEKMELIRRF
ncbi:MAG TPA: TIGR02281 family clan AA aspartic protease [Burkholderiales bacterium]|nr:TIGR02281 family clan AA aspartic protease [Burkholderiales bacterium]